jgi:hypothetical protein
MKISFNQKPVMTVDRTIGRRDKLVYLLLAPKTQKYQRGQSRIMYVGTTSKGVSRIANSVAVRSEAIFEKWGIRSMDVHIVWCTPLQKVKSWKLLERAVLADFVSIYGELPECNKQGKSFQWDTTVSKYFRRTAVTKILNNFCNSKGDKP